MRKGPQLKLVRDISSRTLRISLQFYDKDGSRISPKFRTDEDADCWYQRYLLAQHSGAERRGNQRTRRLRLIATSRERRLAVRRFCDLPCQLIDAYANLQQEIAALLRTGADGRPGLARS